MRFLLINEIYSDTETFSAIDKVFLEVVGTVTRSAIRLRKADRFFGGIPYPNKIFLYFPCQTSQSLRNLKNWLFKKLSLCKGKKNISHFKQYYKDIHRISAINGGKEGWKCFSEFHYYITLAIMEYLRSYKVRRAATRSSFFVLYLADVVLNSICGETSWKLKILEDRPQTLEKLMDRQGYAFDRKFRAIKKYYVEKYIKHMLQIRHPARRIPRKVEVILDILKKTKKRLATVGRELSLCRDQISRFCKYEDFIWRRLIHPCFYNFTCSAKEEVILTEALIGFYKKMIKNDI